MGIEKGVNMSEVEFFTNMSKQIGELCAEIRSVIKRLEDGDKKLAEHEARLTLLEHGPGKLQQAANSEPLKDWIIKALIRIIGWGTVIVGSLVGAGEMLKNIHIG